MDAEIAFLIAVFSGLAALMLWPKIFSAAAPVQILSDESREIVWIELKKKILITDAYTNSVAYERLYNRGSELLSAFVMRHQHYPMGIEAKWGDHGISEVLPMFIEQEREHAAAARSYRISHSLNLENCSQELIFYTCWFAYVGGMSKYLPGQIMSDHQFLCKALDHLIAERKSMDAVFFKGFILKYGLGVYGKPDLRASQDYLIKAAQNGIGAAAYELRHFDKHLVLEAIESVHIENRSWIS